MQACPRVVPHCGDRNFFYDGNSNGAGQGFVHLVGGYFRTGPNVRSDVLLPLRLVADLLGLDPVFCRSSTVGLPQTLKSQERVIAAVKAVGGAHYLNAPGGRGLYGPARFAREGLNLSFLAPCRGPYKCFLPALMTQPLPAILADIRASSRLQPPT